MSNTSLQSFLTLYRESYQVLPPKGPVTLHQKALFVIWIIISFIWLLKRFTSNKISSNEDVHLDIEKNAKENEEKNSNISPKSLTDALFAAFTIGWIMVFYFLCDYLHYFPKADRVYNRDLFIFLSIMLFLVALSFTWTVGPSGKLLNRDQTEEWKGWMQVMFVWYHYFRAAETYNAVRVYIAAYVFMTGFGNFSFFWVRKDYSLRRVLKLLFRLNFLVAVVVLVTDNQYIRYYICGMHTFWFVTVYIMMRPFHELNHVKKVMFAKFALYFVVIYVIFDVPNVAQYVFLPFSNLLGYGDPPTLNEWIFRSGLDHYVTLVGMICAYFHPNLEKQLNFINNHRNNIAINMLISIIIFPILVLWYKYVFVLSKYPYNVLHPYTSFIPIIAYVYFRNSTSWLRRSHCAMFAYLGKITLETYISQIHIYLQNDAKNILVYLPEFPLVNFIFNTFIYLYIANLLFHATVTLNEFIFPSDYKEMFKRIFVIASLVGGSYLVVFVAHFV
ncbi:uncharacterized protein LOC100209243 isoform X2 [Hydra vulgaris]|uniref:Uncharacterized protein LOC100209243 isoform X2 n=1 Tax=Hydra vulgaris TaxID=6087 RepID=A0ABM4BFS8_HYDVU